MSTLKAYLLFWKTRHDERRAATIFNFELNTIKILSGQISQETT
jgi:hypothetical protein